ncbi:hypothetical protein Tco_1340714 [Tanacetum coccineum]
MLSRRDKIRQHVYCKIGNGKNTFMWHDKWNDEGLISNMISMETVIEAGLDRNMKVADMVKQGVWQWPANWHNDIPVVNTISVPRLNKRKDKFSHCIPKHALMACYTWEIIYSRHRLDKWYPGRMDLCALCEECPDSHERLFFKCKYAEKVWKEIKRMIFQDSLSDNWGEIVNQIVCDDASLC